MVLQRFPRKQALLIISLGITVFSMLFGLSVVLVLYVLLQLVGGVNLIVAWAFLLCFGVILYVSYSVISRAYPK